jgi:CRP-like cAMP-binding protein/uncharacterized membrane protein YdbT with pleckstrin-like domain
VEQSLLRSIPLFSNLSGEDIGRVAGLLYQRSYRRRSTIYRQGELDGTLYIVLSGRLRAWMLDEKGQRKTLNYLHANDFFGEHSLLLGERRDVTMEVEEDAVLLSLQKSDFDALLARHPSLGQRLGRDKLERLRRIPLFAGLAAEDLRQLAPLVGHALYRQGTVINRQGEPATALYMIESGRVVMRTGDQTGEERTVTQLRDGDCFGHESLLSGQPSPVTTEATEDTSVFYINPRDLRAFLGSHPALRKALGTDEGSHRRVAKRFSWQREGEELVALSYKHVYAFLKSLWLLIFPLLALAALLGLSLATARGGAPLYAAGTLTVVGALALVAWLFLDWRNDYYAVTNKRVVHVEKTLLLRESRDEAPLENIQDLFIYTPSLMARLVGFNDLGIQTAGSRGKVVFKSLGDAPWVRDRIFEQSERIKNETKAEDREVIRRRLQLKLEPTTDELSSAALPQEASAADRAAEVPQGKQRRGVSEYLMPRMRLEENAVVTWRKHWYRLIDKIVGPLFLLFILVQLGGAAFFDLLRPLRGFRDHFWVALVVGLAIGLFLLWYRYEDWRNDIYQLTDDRIIDIERLPLGLREERREASLAMIQDIRYEIPGITANLLDYGNVVIETAAREAVFTFDWVHRPRLVQQEIFARMDAFREREKQRERDKSTTELLEWFATYSDLAEDQRSPDETSSE